MTAAFFAWFSCTSAAWSAVTTLIVWKGRNR